MSITVIGAGLAGCEAAYQISRFGIPVELIDMKPGARSPAHHSDLFAELVCSNSLKSARIENACGLLKEEMREIGSLCIEAADVSSVPAGNALAVDRDKFSTYITESIRNNNKIQTKEYEVTQIPENRPVIIATGPLTSWKLMNNITELTGSSNMYFYDAAAPVIYHDSIDLSKTFRQSRYNKGADDYINCPLDKDEYAALINALLNAETATVRDFEDMKVFEGCMPVEVMASRGIDTLRFGPMKPVGLTDPSTGKRPYACVQLRQDDTAGTLYSPVGFQTRMKTNEQKRVFGLIPALKDADYARFGVMHRNTFINSPEILNDRYMIKDSTGIFMAGQLTGVEGYVESMASGMAAGIYASLHFLEAEDDFKFPECTMIGALAQYISSANRNFQPMNSNFGIIPPVTGSERMQKSDRYSAYAMRSLNNIRNVKNCLKLFIH